jgi:hypothetical protein
MVIVLKTIILVHYLVAKLKAMYLMYSLQENVIY